jgi:hypothetical protein
MADAPANAWGFLQRMRTDGIGVGQELAIEAWLATRVFQEHGRTLEDAAKLFRIVVQEIQKAAQTDDLQAAVKTAIDTAEEIQTLGVDSNERTTAFKRMKRELALVLITADWSTQWGNSGDVENNSQLPTNMELEDEELEPLPTWDGLRSREEFLQVYLKPKVS